MTASDLRSQLATLATIVDRLPDGTNVGVHQGNTVSLHPHMVVNGPEALRAAGATTAWEQSPGTWTTDIDGLRVFATEIGQHAARVVTL